MADPMPVTEECVVWAHQEIAVDADVTVRPTVEAGPVTAKCVGGPDLDACHDWDGTDAAR